MCINPYDKSLFGMNDRMKCIIRWHQIYRIYKQGMTINGAKIRMIKFFLIHAGQSCE